MLARRHDRMAPFPARSTGGSEPSGDFRPRVTGRTPLHAEGGENEREEYGHQGNTMAEITSPAARRATAKEGRMFNAGEQLVSSHQMTGERESGLAEAECA